jgi:hypothetical protein
MTKTEAIEKIREHLVILASYEIISINTADVLEDYLVDIVGNITEIDTDTFDDVWDGLKNEKRNNDGFN